MNAGILNQQGLFGQSLAWTLQGNHRLLPVAWLKYHRVQGRQSGLVLNILLSGGSPHTDASSGRAVDTVGQADTIVQQCSKGASLQSGRACRPNRYKQTLTRCPVHCTHSNTLPHLSYLHPRCPGAAPARQPPLLLGWRACRSNVRSSLRTPWSCSDLRGNKPRITLKLLRLKPRGRGSLPRMVSTPIHTFNIVHSLHVDESSIWRVEGLKTTWHADQHSVGPVTCKSLDRGDHKKKGCLQTF